VCYLYGAIEKRDAAQRVVEGYISSAATDVNGQIVDPVWLQQALPPWLSSYGNIREQHNPLRAVGKADRVDLAAQPGPYLSARIVDDDAWRKVEAGVYTGFSVGIKNPVIVADAAAPRGRIVGGQLLEVSVVDRPANDAARFVLVKAAGDGTWEPEQAAPAVPATPPESWGISSRAELEQLIAAEVARALAAQLATMTDLTKSVAPDLTAHTAELAETKASLAQLRTDLEAVKRLAAPVKGAVFAVEKGIGGTPDRQVALALDQLTASAPNLTEAQRLEIARQMVRATTIGQ
jgi:phage head maturation protease